jgi:hypothetical protein
MAEEVKLSVRGPTQAQFELQQRPQCVSCERISKALLATIQARADLNRSLANQALAQEPSAAQAGPHVELSARLRRRESNQFLLEVENSGHVNLHDVSWEIPEEARWLTTDVLPDYPVPLLRPGQRVRVPVVISMGRQLATNIKLHAANPFGEPYEHEQLVSIYDD